MTKNFFQKYIKGICSSSETNELLKSFKENPREVDSYFSEEEWIEFYNENNTKIPQKKSEQIFLNVESLIKEDQKKGKNIYLISRSIAASLLILIGIISFWKLNSLTDSSQLAITENSLIKYENFGKENMNIILTDNTKIILFPKSEIQIDTISKSESNVYLNGKASFEVIHNPSRIFKVKCRNLITTDFGTRFLIDGLQKSVRIDLFEGKVSVAKINDIKSKIFLTPGDFVFFDEINQTLVIGSDHEKNKPIHSPNINKRNDDLSVVEVKNVNLKKILDQLSLKYNVSIEYPTEKIDQIQMNMAIDTSQKIEIILKNIALIGDLQLIKKDEKKYILK